MPGTSPGSTGAGRYAPSPTGELHLGNLRTAVLAWLFARSTDRRFLLRIEDLDATRVRPGQAEQQQADLAALGLDFDGEPVVQSHRARRVRRGARDPRGPDLPVLLHPAGDRRGGQRAERHSRSLPRHLPGADRGRAGRAGPASVARPAAAGRRSAADHPRCALRRGQRPGRRHRRPAQRRGGRVQPGGRGRRRGQRHRPGGPRRRPAAGGDQPGLPGHGCSASQPPSYGHVPLAVNRDGVRLAKRDGAVTLADLALRGVSGARRPRPDRRLARSAGRRPRGGTAPPFRPAAPAGPPMDRRSPAISDARPADTPIDGPFPASSVRKSGH